MTTWLLQTNKTKTCEMNVFLLFLLLKDIVEESQKLVDSLDKLRVGAASSSSNFKKKPVIIIVVGMAGKSFH